MPASKPARALSAGPRLSQLSQAILARTPERSRPPCTGSASAALVSCSARQTSTGRARS
jgi:hypothetical protein